MVDILAIGSGAVNAYGRRCPRPVIISQTSIPQGTQGESFALARAFRSRRASLALGRALRRRLWHGPMTSL